MGTSFVANAVTSNQAAVRFAHPAESIVASLLDIHNVAWQYEPTTFPLETTPEGRPLQSFTPDFYLPECDTYIEMTTMRQSLVTRKNRKFRLLRERYPDLNVHLLYRRDVELISNHYREKTTVEPLRAGSLLVSEETLFRRVDDLANQCLLAVSAEPVTVLSLGDGARTFAGALADRWSAASARNPSVVLLQYRRGKRPHDHVQFGLSGSIPADSQVVLAADVVGTGLTVHSAITWLSDRGIPVDALVALADRKSARIVDVPLSGSIVHAPSSWLTGFGIGGDQRPGLHLIEN